MAGKDYDVAAAFQAIEYELINSFFRNMKKHKVDEVKEQKQWEMWQVKQLQELDLYKKRNTEKYGTKFTDINKTIAEMIRLSNEEGQMDQETEILSAMEKGLKPQRAPEQMTAQFFRTNDRKLDTLINATVSDMEKAEVAVLRKADDVYRKTIFNAMVYANTGAGTYEKAIDMATKDFMKAGLTCVEYKNGSKHTISDYADMAVRTANKRAYLQGEGAKRQEWGIHTVIVNKRLMACPHCMPFAGKVFIDDVWGGGTAADGDYPLLSEAVAAGLYHPRCKDSHTAYFPGITGKPKKYTKAEVKEAEKAEEQERKADYAERQAESYQRVADTRLDPENKRTEQARADRWSKLRDKYHSLGNKTEDPMLRRFYDRREEEFEAISGDNRLQKLFRNVRYKDGNTTNDKKSALKSVISKLEGSALEWNKMLTNAQRRSIQKYTYNPGDRPGNRFFERVNAMLRGDIPYNRDLAKHVENISNGIKKFPLDEEIIVYRGTDFDPSAGKKVGEIFKIKQFYSTSVDKTKIIKGRKYLVMVKVKKGAAAAYVDYLSIFNQTELLLDKNQVCILKSRKGNVIEIEVI